MNIKSLSIKNNSDSNEVKTAYIEFEGEGVITAADIRNLKRRRRQQVLHGTYDH